MQSGKIVVIEGTDFSGKTTQYENVSKMLKDKGYQFGSDSFPNYDSESSFFVKQYLGGVYGENATDIDPKTASVFYALDRYNSFKTRKWGNIYRNGGNILFARYLTSNILHQAAKYDTWEEKKAFIDWLYSFECDMLAIPKENNVILLDMPTDKGQELKQQRLKEQGGLASSGKVKDIHENNTEYLRKSYATAKEVADYLGWSVVSCVDKDGNIKPILDISNEICAIVESVFNSVK